MNWTAALLLAGFLHASAAGFGQAKVTLSLRNAPLEKIFDAIEKQSDYTFWYDNDVLKNIHPIDIDVRDVTIDEALISCCLNLPITYSITGKMITIKIKSGDHNLVQKVSVQGRVMNEKGEPVVGAAILIKGTKNGTQTDPTGHFSLDVLSGTETIIISSVGYESREIKLTGKSSIEVILKISVSSLDETVVKGYYNTTKRLNTGDVSTIDAKTIAEQPISNPLEALEGRAPGLYITQQSGFTGGGFTVHIRGLNSINSGNNPLYIIDGIPYPSVPVANSDASAGNFNGGNPLNSLNPLDIESVSVLKDADATSIYGSRGANGVILITTKKGSAGATKANASLYFGAGQIARKMDLLKTQTYLQMRRDAFVNDNQIPNASNAPDLVSWDTTRYTDWQKTLIGGTSRITDAETSLSGGNDNTQFLFGLGYHQESSVFPGNTGARRVSANLNLSHSSRDQKLKFTVFGNYSVFNNNQYGTDLTTAALTTAPDTPPIYDSSGKINWDGGRFNNPYGIMQRNYLSNTGTLLSHAEISYQLNSHLQILVNGGYNDIHIEEVLTNPKTSYTPRFHISSGNSIFSNGSLQTWIIEPQIQYKSLIGKGSLQILIGSTFEQDINQAKSIQGTGYTSDALLSDMQAASSLNVTNLNQTNYKYEAFFGRINYSWQDRYLLNITGRRDGSSRFGPGKQFANFGAVGAGWIFSKTAWMQKHFPLLNFGKLRASYGTTGNDQIGDYQYLDTYSPTYYTYLGVSGLISTRLYNPDYSWETNKKLEAGLELNFWNSRISTVISWYRNHSSDQLVGYPVPLITGQSSVQSNLPAVVQNTGWEFVLSITPIKSLSFQWYSSINLTIPSNTLLSFPNLASSPYANIYEVGKPLYIRKRFHYTGVDEEKGIYTFEDVNHDGIVSYPEDLTAYKEVAQTYYGGFENSFEYRSLRFDIFFQFVKQTGPNYLYSTFNAPGRMSNQPTYVLDNWKKPGDQKPVQEYTQAFGSDANSAYLTTQSFGDNAIGDASFIRLKNISLSYSFKPSVLQKIHATALSLFIQAQNLFTITDFQGLDPENQNISVLPPLRIVTAGFRCSF
jgi:TonB-linked SusC/RagA family outer membrane protein